MGTKKRYTPEMAVDLLAVSDVQISPDGSRVAFSVAPVGHIETNPTSAIFVAPSDGSSTPVCVVGRECNNSSPRWSPNGTSIAFLSDRAKRGESQLHVVHAGGGQPLRLTGVREGVSSPSWMPDGQALAVSVSRHGFEKRGESKSEIKVASERIRPRGLVLVPVLGGAGTPVGPEEGHVWSYAVSPDGTRVAAATSPSEDLSDSWDNVQLRIYPIQSNDIPVDIGRFSRPTDQITWSSDGNHLAFLTAKLPEAPHGCVWIVNTQTGELTALDERGMSQNWVGFEGSSLVVLSVEGQRTRLDTTDIAGKGCDRFDLPDELSRRWIRDVSLSSDGRTMAVLAEPDTAPADIWTVQDGSAATRITRMNPQLENIELSNLESLNWQSTDGTSIDGWLLRPPGAEDGTNLPLVVYVHGGPSWQWGNWFHGTWHDWAHILAARGFAVLLPNPRGSTGRGGDFTAANENDLGGLDFTDIMTGVDHLVERGIADPDRLGIGGWSYGGFIVAWALGKTGRFKAAIAGAAVTNWVSKIGTTDIRRMNESHFPGQLHEEPDALWERSPVRYLKDMQTPTLILHGEADPRVPVTQGLELYQGLKALGVDTEFVTYPRQKHAFHERAFQLDLLQRVCDWYERYLK
ncbi:S9 family peptidase [soil metagenome]